MRFIGAIVLLAAASASGEELRAGPLILLAAPTVKELKALITRTKLIR